ncbi:MAG: hypothetical protein RID91_00305 [Azospirillaceae bacterium]
MTRADAIPADPVIEARTCYAHLAGTERRPHLAGPLGREFTRFLVLRGLIARRSGTRAVTPAPGWLATLGLADDDADRRPDAA